MSKERVFIKGKVKPLQYGAKALSIHKDSITMKGDWFNIIVAAKKDGTGDYMYLDEFEPQPQTTPSVSKTDFGLDGKSGFEDLPF